MFRVLSCITDQHDLRLVALSACICALGCFTTVMLLARAQWTDQRWSLRWQLSAALIFGCSVWSLHFVAMLAFQSGMPIAYDVDLTALSAFIAAVGAMPAFLLQRSNVSPALLATVTNRAGNRRRRIARHGRRRHALRRGGGHALLGLQVVRPRLRDGFDRGQHRLCGAGAGPGGRVFILNHDENKHNILTVNRGALSGDPTIQAITSDEPATLRTGSSTH